MEQEKLLLFVNFLSKNLHLKPSKRNSCKVYNNGECEDNRVIYSFNNINEEKIVEIISVMEHNPEYSNYLTRRFKDGDTFFISFAPNILKLYIEREISYDNACDYIQINYLTNEITYGFYKHCQYNGTFINKLKPIKDNLRSNFEVVRTDGQIYFKFKKYNSILIIIDNLILLSNNEKYRNWLHTQYGSPTWVQISDNSFTIYCKEY